MVVGDMFEYCLYFVKIIFLMGFLIAEILNSYNCFVSRFLGFQPSFRKQTTMNVNGHLIVSKSKQYRITHTFTI